MTSHSARARIAHARRIATDTANYSASVLTKTRTKRLTYQCASPTRLNALCFGERKETTMEKFNGLIIDDEVFEVIKGECNKHCAF